MAFECVSPAYVEYLDRTVRCGKCLQCVALKGWLKRQLVGLEVLGHQGERAWFCTFTFREVQQEEKEAYGLVQKWLKRLRKNHPDNRFRYIAVREHGAKGGRLHYHLLLFCECPVTWRGLPKWAHGFSVFKLADESAWEYVIKYCQKAKGVKVRGSTKLGENTVETVAGHPLVRSVMDALGGSYLVRVGGFRVPRKLAMKHTSPPVLDDDEAWMRSASDALLREHSISEEVSGMPDAVWHEWMKSTKQVERTRNLLRGKTTLKDKGFLPQPEEDAEVVLGNRGETSPDNEEGPDGS